MNKSVPLILNFKLFLVEKMRAMLWTDLRWDGALTGCPHPRGQFHVISGLGMLSCGLFYCISLYGLYFILLGTSHTDLLTMSNFSVFYTILNLQEYHQHSWWCNNICATLRWMNGNGVLQYFIKHLAAMSLLNEPFSDLFPIIILLAVLTPNSVVPLNCG